MTIEIKRSRQTPHNRRRIQIMERAPPIPMMQSVVTQTIKAITPWRDGKRKHLKRNLGRMLDITPRRRIPITRQEAWVWQEVVHVNDAQKINPPSFRLTMRASIRGFPINVLLDLALLSFVTTMPSCRSQL